MSSEDLRYLTEAILDLSANPGDRERRRRLCTVLYQRLRYFLLGSLQRLVPPFLRADLDDLLQSTLYGLFRKAIQLCEGGKLRVEGEDESLEAYFRTVAWNEMKDQITRAAKDRRMLPLQEEPLAMTPPEDSPRSEELRAALLRLPESARKVVQMRLEGHSFEVIASELHSNAGAERVRFFRAVKQLRQLLRPSPGAEL